MRGVHGVIVMFTVTFGLTGVCFAQTVAAGKVGAARMEPVWNDVEEEVRLRRHDREALKILRGFGANRESGSPMHGGNGTVVFPYGTTAVRILCAPLRVCDVALQPGEELLGLHMGDIIRWTVKAGDTGGGGARTTHLVITPKSANLRTNVVVHTDRRVYQFELVSRKGEHMPLVAFSYPGDDAMRFESYVASRLGKTGDVIDKVGPWSELDGLNFRYTVEVDGERRRKRKRLEKTLSWFPRRVFDNGKKTIIELPEEVHSREMPVLLVRYGGEDEIVNYRPTGHFFVVDRLFDRAVLLSGVGRDQTRVVIAREAE